MPVDLDRALDVAGLVEQHVFVGFDDDQARRAEVFGEPFGAHQTLGVGVAGEGGGGVGLDGHSMLLHVRLFCPFRVCSHSRAR